MRAAERPRIRFKLRRRLEQYGLRGAAGNRPRTFAQTRSDQGPIDGCKSHPTFVPSHLYKDLDLFSGT